MMDAILQWGVGIVLALQTLRVSGLEGLARFFTFLGTEEFFLLVMPALYWCFDAALGARLAVVLITSNTVNGLAKLFFHLPRPYWIDRGVRALTAETSYGLPSGHAQNAAAVWGFLAAQLKRGWAWAAAIGLILGISLSRVYLGVHFPTDLLGGWLIGGALLFAFLRWERPVAAWLRRLGLWLQMGLALAASLAFLVLSSVMLTGIASTPDPAEWEQNAAAARPDDTPPAIDPRDPRSAVNGAGMIFGLGAGLALAARHARFNARGPWGKRAARFVVGILGVLAFWVGLSAVFPTEPFLLGMAFRYVRYALTVFWALYLAPWMFLRTGLANPAASSLTPA